MTSRSEIRKKHIFKKCNSGFCLNSLAKNYHQKTVTLPLKLSMSLKESIFFWIKLIVVIQLSCVGSNKTDVERRLFTLINVAKDENTYTNDLEHAKKNTNQVL